MTFSDREGEKGKGVGGMEGEREEKIGGGGEGNQQWRGEGNDRSEEQPCSPSGVFSKFSTPGTIKTKTGSPASRSIAREGVPWAASACSRGPACAWEPGSAKHLEIQ